MGILSTSNFEEIASRLSGVKKFTKLDANKDTGKYHLTKKVSD